MGCASWRVGVRPFWVAAKIIMRKLAKRFVIAHFGSPLHSPGADGACDGKGSMWGVGVLVPVF